MERRTRIPLSALAGVLLVAGCFETSTGPVPFDTAHRDFDFPAGRIRLMARAFTIESADSIRTYYAPGGFKIGKDTVFTDALFRHRMRELFLRTVCPIDPPAT